jgi:hypothetical protein
MLCDDCQRKKICPPALIAKNDPQLQKMLERLRRCELRVADQN